LTHFAGTLETLILDSNQIGDELPQIPCVMPKLHTFMLNNNHVADINVLLKSLVANCPALTYLSLLNNPCCPLTAEQADKDLFRKCVLTNLTKLKFLDWAPVSAKERQEARVFVALAFAALHPPVFVVVSLFCRPG